MEMNKLTLFSHFDLGYFYTTFSLSEFVRKFFFYSLSVDESKTSKTEAEYHVLNQVGFSVLPKGEVSAYSPPVDASLGKTVFVTMFYLNEEGSPKILHDNKPVEAKTSWVISRLGGLVESCQKKPFVAALDNLDHSLDTCSECQGLSNVCKVCFIETRISKIQENIGTIQKCQLGHSLVQLLSDLQTEKICRKNEEGKKMLKQIEDLAKAYWSLETDTKRVVSKVKAYGESLEVV
jgi:hypothetical protein